MLKRKIHAADGEPVSLVGVVVQTVAHTRRQIGIHQLKN